MTPSKLSDSEKHAAARLYREPGETTSTLAKRYGVSSTTIRRALKSNLSHEEYETLTSQKQIERWQEVGAPKQSFSDQQPSHTVDINTNQETVAQQELSLDQPRTASTRRSRKRSFIPTPALDQLGAIADVSDTVATDSSMGLEDEVPVESETLNNFDLAQVYDSGESIDDVREFLEELDEGDARLEELNDEELEDDLETLPPEPIDEKIAYPASQIHPEVLMNVLPLSEALMPRTCYLVVDRSAELIARPLKEFCDLGQVPQKEVQEKTLPVFDNHRVARRFSNRSQRVIKIPDGGMLQKACSQLHAKGITRLLINGRVYSL